MKKILSVLILAIFPAVSNAGDIATSATYFGPIQGVGVGFYSHVGVGLPPGQTCHGLNTVVLLTSNPRYKDILAVLFVAETAKQSVKLFALGSQTTPFGAAYCVITEASLGEFPLW